MKSNKPRHAEFQVATNDRQGCAAHPAAGRPYSCAECKRAPYGRGTRKGYVLGDYATHKDKGRGVYFYTFTHLPTGLAVNVYPPHETKASALAHLATLADGTAPQCARVADMLARYGSGWGGAK